MVDFFDENGELHIMVTANTPVPVSSNGVQYQVATYSYAELEDYQVLISRFNDELGFQATGIDQEENKVTIYTSKDINCDRLFELIPSNAVKIVIGDYAAEYAATYTATPGTKVVNSDTNNYASIACGVVWDNKTDRKWGFLTAGHLGSVGDNVTYNGASMGTITEKQESGSVDAALIKNEQTSNRFDYSDTFPDGKRLTLCGGAFPKNTYVYAYGATSGAMNGKILDASFSCVVSGIKYTKMVLTDMGTDGGDSGGPVITSYSDTYSIIGCITARVQSTGQMVYTNMQEIMTAFDLISTGR